MSTEEDIPSDCYDIEKLGKLQHQSAWVDVERKAKAMLDGGRIVLYHKRPYDLEMPHDLVEISGNITGDHGRYNAKIIIPHPKSRAVRTWSCQCTWSRYVWDRRPIYKVDQKGRTKEVNKKFEGRLCSHVLGLWWMSFNLPVEYEDVKPEVLKYYLPQMAEQGRLLDNDELKLLEVQSEEDRKKEKRLSPRIMDAIFGIDINLLNKSINEAFDLAPADQIVQEMKDAIAIVFSETTTDDQKRDAYNQWLALRDKKNVYDNDASLDVKKDISERLIRFIELRKSMPRRLGPEGFWPDRQEYEDLRREVPARMRLLQEIYDANVDAEKMPRIKAQDAVEQFHWWEVNDNARGKKYMDEFMRSNDPRIFAEMMNERLQRESQMAMHDLPGVPRTRTPQRQEPQEISEPVEIAPGQMGFDFGKQTSFSVISSDVPINDIVIYIQNELARNTSPVGYVRKELWGEQRGGLHPHPDALPIRVRPDGNFIYSLDDLGYDPENGAMGANGEERGTYGAVPVGSEVRILSVDPRDRMVLINHDLDGDGPNHTHIHIWVPLKDIDLI